SVARVPPLAATSARLLMSCPLLMFFPCTEAPKPSPISLEGDFGAGWQDEGRNHGPRLGGLGGRNRTPVQSIRQLRRGGQSILHPRLHAVPFLNGSRGSERDERPEVHQVGTCAGAPVKDDCRDRLRSATRISADPGTKPAVFVTSRFLPVLR